MNKRKAVKIETLPPRTILKTAYKCLDKTEARHLYGKNERNRNCIYCGRGSL